MQTDPNKVAASLTKAQPAILNRLHDLFWKRSDELVSLHHQRPANTAASLCRKGLAERRHHLLTLPTEYRRTSFGLEVIRILREKQHD